MKGASHLDSGKSILDQVSEISALIGEAARGSVLVLSRRQLARFEQGSEAEFKNGLRMLCGHHDDCAGRPSSEIFSAHEVANLQHAPAWVDSGAVYEQMLEVLREGATPDYVFCLDPWAAQLLNQREESAFGARWIYVSDLSRRREDTYPKYWPQLEQWLGRLPFFATIPKAAWDEAIGSDDEAVACDLSPRIHLQKHGAWQWRKITRSAQEVPQSEHLLFLVRSSGSSPHLRVFLESLARQNCPKSSLSALILPESAEPNLKGTLEWFALANSQMKFDAAQVSGSPGEAWRDQLAGILNERSPSLVILTSDHCVLPEGFARSVLETVQSDAIPILLGVPISLDASAQIITGNLDPLPNYGTLLQSFALSPGSDVMEGARIVPSERWRLEDGDAVSAILDAAKAEPPRNGDRRPRMGLLQLADLP